MKLSTQRRNQNRTYAPLRAISFSPLLAANNGYKKPLELKINSFIL